MGFLYWYYVTRDGHLIDSNGNIIDDQYIVSNASPQLKVRNVNLSNIDKVDFYIDLELTPQKKIVSHYITNENGEKEPLERTEQILAETIKKL